MEARVGSSLRAVGRKACRTWAVLCVNLLIGTSCLARLRFASKLLLSVAFPLALWVAALQHIPVYPSAVSKCWKVEGVVVVGELLGLAVSGGPRGDGR